MRCSDSRPPVSPAFVSFARRLPPWRLCSLRTARRRPRGLELLSGSPHHFEEETVGSPRFLGNPDGPMPWSWTPAGPARQARKARRCSPRLRNSEGSRDLTNFGARSHGLGPGCLRFVRPVARFGRKTRFPVLAKLSGAGLFTRRVPPKGFGDVSYIASPFPRLRLAQSPLWHTLASAPARAEPQAPSFSGNLRI